jgi:two-component system, OmpR family, phosphate regulon response regulator PhoB
VRSILYRFPDLGEFEGVVTAEGDAECELGLPAGETVEDGEWILAIFELGPGRRATSAAGRAVAAPDGARLLFELRDWRRLVEFSRKEATKASILPPPSSHDEGADRGERSDTERPPNTARSPGARPSQRAAGPGARVLIVDDDPDIREVVSAMLEAVGLVVVPVGSAEDALERVHEEAFDLLVLDWNLPKMTGLDLCRLLRKDPDLGTIPVLFLTANASSQDMVEAFACGGDDYVVKPFRAPELGARIFSLLRRARGPAAG